MLRKSIMVTYSQGWDNFLFQMHIWWCILNNPFLKSLHVLHCKTSVNNPPVIALLQFQELLNQCMHVHSACRSQHKCIVYFSKIMCTNYIVMWPMSVVFTISRRQMKWLNKFLFACSSILQNSQRKVLSAWFALKRYNYVSQSPK